MVLEKIRLATPEEIEEIAPSADLTPMCRVMKMGEMTAVWRVANELDPVFYADAPDPRKVKFIWGIENIMKGAGLTEFYFNVPVGDEKYQKIVEHFGAQRTSKEPEYRYKLPL